MFITPHQTISILSSSCFFDLFFVLNLGIILEYENREIFGLDNFLTPKLIEFDCFLRFHIRYVVTLLAIIIYYFCHSPTFQFLISIFSRVFHVLIFWWNPLENFHRLPDKWPQHINCFVSTVSKMFPSMFVIALILSLLTWSILDILQLLRLQCISRDNDSCLALLINFDVSDPYV